MSKGLVRLKELSIKLCENCPYNKPNMDGDVCSKCEEKLDIIKKELKEYEQLKEMYNHALEVHSKLSESIVKYKKKDKALEIIKHNFRLLGNCLHATNPYAEDGWVFVKEIENEEEYNAWEEVLK